MLQQRVMNQMKALARRARLASASGQPLEFKLTPEESAALAEAIDEALAEDQIWFWSEAWQAGEWASEADLAEGRYQDFETMEGMLRDLGKKS
jgi:hypothetical protein